MIRYLGPNMPAFDGSKATTPKSGCPLVQVYDHSDGLILDMSKRLDLTVVQPRMYGTGCQ